MRGQEDRGCWAICWSWVTAPWRSTTKSGGWLLASADLFFAYGSNAERMVTGAITGGMPPNCVYHFDSHEQMAKMVRNRARSGDMLLFKGSRGMRMEHVLQLFLDGEQK